jgi:hypothetical protein
MAVDATSLDKSSTLKNDVSGKTIDILYDHPIPNPVTKIKCLLAQQVIISYLNVIKLILPEVKDHAMYL